MKRRTSAVSLVLVVLAALGLAGSLAAGEQVPFRGRLEGTFAITPVAPTVVFVLLTGTGEATHLGEFAFTVPHFVDVSTGNGVATGAYQFTAANGDTLFAAFNGQSTPTTNPDVHHIVETATITGGTGRFADATGAFIVDRLINVVTSTTSGSFDGTISSPGS